MANTKSELCVPSSFSLLSDTTCRGYELLWQASELNHTRAAERVAFALLFGDFAPFAAGVSGGVLSRGGGQRFLEARRLLEKAAESGSPRAQFVRCALATKFTIRDAPFAYCTRSFQNTRLACCVPLLSRASGSSTPPASRSIPARQK